MESHLGLSITRVSQSLHNVSVGSLYLFPSPARTSPMVEAQIVQADKVLTQ